MQIISFAWTTPALLAGAKTVTRRDWTDRHAAQFHKGDLVQAWDQSPRAGGHRVGVIHLTDDPRFEPLADMPDSDYQAEGFEWITKYDAAPPHRLLQATPEGFAEWRASGRSMWVVRFSFDFIFIFA